MKYTSQRNPSIQTDIASAILSGLAPDGGLFGPEYLPKINLSDFNSNMSYPVFAQKVLNQFFVELPLLQKELSAMCETAFNFSIPTVKLNQNTFFLELFHGPTLSFKDVGARFLGQCFSTLSKDKKTTVFVVTSGDTGSAVACALDQKENIDVVILYPQGRVSERQKQQITCWHKNILALEVDGNFDACQAIAKVAFSHPWWKEHTRLTTANSMNVGRLLPQITYYAYSSFHFYQQHKKAPGYIIPSGNLGNATAAFWAKAMGFPIREIVLATNANRVVSDYLATGQYAPQASIPTLANAMDVGNPSNFARLQVMFPENENFKQQVKAFSVDDQQIKQTMKRIYEKNQVVICPHTATAAYVREQLSDEPWIIVSTAHPAKFESIVEPLLEINLPVPDDLQNLLNKPSHFISVAADLDEVTRKYRTYLEG